MVGNGQRGCACELRVERRGSLAERGGFPSIDHLRTVWPEGL